MVCPECKRNSIPFLKAWTRSGLGQYRCPQCGAISRLKKSMPLMMGSMILGIFAAGSAVYTQSWKVLIVAAVIALVLDALMDLLFRRLELVEPNP